MRIETKVRNSIRNVGPQTYTRDYLVLNPQFRYRGIQLRPRIVERTASAGLQVEYRADLYVARLQRVQLIQTESIGFDNPVIAFLARVHGEVALRTACWQSQVQFCL